MIKVKGAHYITGSASRRSQSVNLRHLDDCRQEVCNLMFFLSELMLVAQGIRQREEVESFDEHCIPFVGSYEGNHMQFYSSSHLCPFKT